MHGESMGVIKAFVHCPMIPIAIGAYVTGAAWGDFTVLPSGCSVNHYTVRCAHLLECAAFTWEQCLFDKNL